MLANKKANGNRVQRFLRDGCVGFQRRHNRLEPGPGVNPVRKEDGNNVALLGVPGDPIYCLFQGRVVFLEEEVAISNCSEVSML